MDGPARTPRTVGWVDDTVVLPGWLHPLAEACRSVTAADLTRFVPPEVGGRASAVLILFGENDLGPDVLVIERAAAMRTHAGQPGFPGGALDPEDDGPVAAALREAHEETGLDPRGVEVFAVLPDLWIPVSDFIVTPVLGWWRTPSPVSPRDAAEVSGVHRVTVAELIDPEHRVRVQHPSGWIGPGFEVRGMLIWGFTGGLLTRLLDLAGWSLPWSQDRLVPVE